MTQCGTFEIDLKNVKQAILVIFKKLSGCPMAILLCQSVMVSIFSVYCELIYIYLDGLNSEQNVCLFTAILLPQG